MNLAAELKNDFFKNLHTPSEEKKPFNLKKINKNNLYDFLKNTDVFAEIMQKENPNFKISKDQFFTVPDAIDFKIDKGSENFYFEIEVYHINPKNEEDYKSYKVLFWTKDNHQFIKDLISLYLIIL
jgi:hypothetical protein